MVGCRGTGSERKYCLNVSPSEAQQELLKQALAWHEGVRGACAFWFSEDLHLLGRFWSRLGTACEFPASYKRFYQILMNVSGAYDVQSCRTVEGLLGLIAGLRFINQRPRDIAGWV